MGKPLLDVVLKPGDMLYFPRGIPLTSMAYLEHDIDQPVVVGYAHQAVSTEDKHSLHLTVSTYQLFDWAQYMQKVEELRLVMASANVLAHSWCQLPSRKPSPVMIPSVLACLSKALATWAWLMLSR
jgi:hypothetical protein